METRTVEELEAVIRVRYPTLYAYGEPDFSARISEDGIEYSWIDVNGETDCWDWQRQPEIPQGTRLYGALRSRRSHHGEIRR